MSDVDKVLEFIDNFYSNASQRPKMYFTSPEAFEDTVSVLERLGNEHLKLTHPEAK
jgi:hypothetical protein